MTKKIIHALWLPVGLLVGASVVNAAERKDPRLRDDDISPTTISVDVSRNAHGHYAYTYDLVMPEANTGQVRSFVLAIGCAEAVDSRGFGPSDYPSDAKGNFSRDGWHVPVAIVAPREASHDFAISETNRAHWGVYARPGSSRRGLQLISPYPPGPREYRLVPSINYNWNEWDYDDIEEETPNVPWIDDMTVAGIIAGPACPGEDYSDDSTGGLSATGPPADQAN